MSITKHVIFIVKKECIEDMKALLKTMVKATQEESGCLFYHICQFKNEPEKFVILESWRDEAALDFHKNTEHYKHYKTAHEPYCEEKHFYDLEVL